MKDTNSVDLATTSLEHRSSPPRSPSKLDNVSIDSSTTSKKCYHLNMIHASRSCGSVCTESSSERHGLGNRPQLDIFRSAPPKSTETPQLDIFRSAPETTETPPTIDRAPLTHRISTSTEGSIVGLRWQRTDDAQPTLSKKKETMLYFSADGKSHAYDDVEHLVNTVSKKKNYPPVFDSSQDLFPIRERHVHSSMNADPTSIPATLQSHMPTPACNCCSTLDYVTMISSFLCSAGPNQCFKPSEQIKENSN